MAYELLDDAPAAQAAAAAPARFQLIDEPPVTWQDRVQAHQAGVFRGAAYLAGMVPDTVANVGSLAVSGYDAARHAMGANWADLPRPWSPNPVGGYLAKQLDKFHDYTPTTVDRPDDAASRYIGAVSSAIPGAAVASGSTAGTLAQALMQTGKTTAGAALPIVAGQAVGEAKPFGGNEAANNAASIAAQLAAGLAQPAAAAGTRGLIRGGEAGRQQMLANTQSFRNVGAEPTVGQAAATRRMQFVESGLSKLPGSAGVMAKAAEAQAEDMGTGVGNISTSLSPGSLSAERAGRAIDQGVSGAGGFRDQFKTTAANLYDRVDRLIPPTTAVPVSNTIQTLDALGTPVPGATATSSLLLNPKVAAIRNAIQQDAGQSGTLPYQALSGIRSQVGSMLSGNELISDIPKGQLKQLYGAISQDMEAQARAAGPQAAHAFSRASNYYKSGLDRLDTLSDVVNRGGPESVFTAALSGTKEGATRLRSVMQSLDEPAQKTVAATVLQRLGRATAGNQNAAGDVFNPETFLTNWNRMSPEAKTALFDRFEGTVPGFRARIDNLAQVTQNLREGSKVFRNPSGTAGANHQLGELGAILGAVGAGYSLYGATGVSAAIATPAMAYGLSRALTSPGVVDWAGRQTPLFGPGQQAAAIAAPANLSAQEQQRRQLTQALISR